MDACSIIYYTHYKFAFIWFICYISFQIENSILDNIGPMSQFP